MKKLFDYSLWIGSLFFLVGCQLNKETGAVSPPVVAVTSAETFEKTIKPFFENTCLECHNHKKHQAGLNFQDPTTIFGKNETGPFLDPGSPETSRIYVAIIKPKTHPGAMPANGWGIDLTDLQLLRTWIKEGAKWPEGPAGQLVVRAHQPKPEDQR